MSSPIIRDRHLNSNKEPGSLPARPMPRSGESLLGTTTKSASTLENTGFQKSLPEKFANNENRYALQKIAQKLSPGERVCSCMKTVAPTQNAVKVVYDDTNRHAHYRNLMRCDSVWICPVCSGRITSHRANEIRNGYAYAVDTLGFRVVMATYTMSHTRFDSLQDNLDSMRDARRKLRSGRAWQTFKRNFGYQGCISALETTWSSDAGWHVHVHEIMFFDPGTAIFELHEDDRKLEAWLHAELAVKWQESLNKVGRNCTLVNGLKFDATDQYVAQYIAKQGKLPAGINWDIALELTKSNQKISKGGLHPFQILELAGGVQLEEKKRNQYVALWHEYVDAFKGRRQIFWTNGLKDILQVDLVEEDGDIEEQGDQVYLVAREMWRDIVYLDKRAELLNNTILWRCDTDKINRYLKRVAADANLKRRTNAYWRRE